MSCTIDRLHQAEAGLQNSAVVQLLSCFWFSIRLLNLRRQIARIKQKRGYKDQWPFNVKLYTGDDGRNKGDGVLTYEDPQAAHSAGGFFSGELARRRSECY